MNKQRNETNKIKSNWVICKFGGTSVANLQCWKNIVTISRQHLDNKLRPLIVCSAPKGVSNMLEELIAEALSDQQEIIFSRIKTLYKNIANELELNFSETIDSDFSDPGHYPGPQYQ